MNARFSKDPSAILDYGLEWRSWLSQGDELATATWTVTGADDELVVLSEGGRAPSVSDTAAKCWLSGGTPGTTYRLACRVTTTGGRVDERSITIAVVER